MRNWKRRELALLAVFLTLATWRAYDAIRVRVGRMERFEIAPGELEIWAQEMDPSVRLSPAKVDVAAGNVPTTAFGHWEFEVPDAEVHAIVNNWERRFREKIRRNGWRFVGSGSGGDQGMRRFQIRFRNGDSYYETYLYATCETDLFATPKNGGRRVRLSVDWFAVGYSRLQSDRHNPDDIPIQVDDRKPTVVEEGGSGP